MKKFLNQLNIKKNSNIILKNIFKVKDNISRLCRDKEFFTNISNMLHLGHEHELFDLINIVYVRRKIVSLFFVFVVLGTLVGSLLQNNIYRASVTLIIDKDNPNLLEVKDVVALGTENYASYADYFQTQKAILRSRGLLKRVFNKLNLKDKKEFDVKYPILKLSKQITIEEIRNTRILKVHVDDKDAEFATKLANAMAQIYVAQNIEKKISLTTDISKWLDKENIILRRKVKESELKLQEFKEAHNIVSLEDKQNIILEKLKVANSKLIKARAERISLETVYTKYKESVKDKVDFLPYIPDSKKDKNDSILWSLKEKYIEVESTIAEFSKKYKDKHPKMTAVYAEKYGVINRIKKEIENEYSTLVQNEAALNRELEKQKKDALNLNRMAIEYNHFKRESESTKNMYQLVLKRQKETSVTGNIQANNIIIQENADIPLKHIKPKRKINMILSFIVGLLGGIGIAFFLNYLDNTVKDKKDIEKHLNYPFLGIVPDMDEYITAEEEKSKDIIAHVSPASMITESYRAIRTAIMYSTASEQKRQDILISSPLGGEGKSLTAVNLGIVMGQNNNKVLLVDCDLRKPRMSKIVNSKKKIGLSSYLVGVASIEEIIEDTEFLNVSVVPSGPIPPNPSELLSSGKMKEFIENAKEHFDKIIIDTPPVTVVTDASILAGFVDSVLLVVSSNKTPKTVLSRMKNILDRSNAMILGVILNLVKVKSKTYYNNYYKN